jgi:2-succinyl-6-hydroxy-2,4-cyclohexadiene-1-carboxylate synthase
MHAEFTALCLDAAGHGDNVDGRRSLPQCADDIASAIQPGILVGYSMGARMALHVALQHPETVSQLVLISGTPGLTTQAERAARIQSDNELAHRIEQIGTEAFIDEWLALPIFSGLTDETNQRSQRLHNSPKGLADSLRHAGTGTQESQWEHLHRLTMPVHLVVGGNDTKFVAIAKEMHALLDDSHLSLIPNVGHTVHLENSAATGRLLDSIILRND